MIAKAATDTTTIDAEPGALAPAQLALLRSTPSGDRWPVNSKFRREVVERLMQIIGDDKAGTRAQVMAARALVQLEAQNQADEHLDIKYERADQGLPEETIVLKATFDE